MSLDRIIAGLIAVIVTVVSWHSLRRMSTLDNPVIPICIGAITFVACEHGVNSQLSVLLIPYEALGITLVIIILLLLLRALLKRLRTKQEASEPKDPDPSLSNDEAYRTGDEQ